MSRSTPSIPVAPPHDPDCLLIDKNHDGPHYVRPGHPKLRSTPQVFRCAFDGCHYSMWDAAYDDINEHWLEHVGGPR